MCQSNIHKGLGCLFCFANSTNVFLDDICTTAEASMVASHHILLSLSKMTQRKRNVEEKKMETIMITEKIQYNKKAAVR